MVILAGLVFIGTDVERTGQGDQVFSGITSAETGFLMDRGSPHSLQLHLGKALVHEFDGKTGHGLFVIKDMEEAVVGEFTQNGDFNIPFCSQTLEFFEFFRGNCKAHAFLGFGNKDLPGLKTGVLQRSFGQIETAAAAFLGHFAHA